MKIATLTARRGALLAAGVALALAGLLALLAHNSPTALAGLNDNQNNCVGHIEKGDANPDDPTLQGVKYRIACAAPITGYTLFVDGHPVQSIETEVFALDSKTKDVVPTDAFSCNAELPGYGVNCIGTYGGDFRVIEGQFTIDSKLCDEPRVDPILSVMNATVSSAGKPVQAIAGPFDLGRPHGCPKSKYGGKTKIPKSKDKDETIIQPAPAA